MPPSWRVWKTFRASLWTFGGVPGVGISLAWRVIMGEAVIDWDWT